MVFTTSLAENGLPVVLNRSQRRAMSTVSISDQIPAFFAENNQSLPPINV